MRQRSVKLGIGLLGSAVILGGCVASESSRYTNKLSSVVESDETTRGEVATAFGLDESSNPPTAMANVTKE